MGSVDWLGLREQMRRALAKALALGVCSSPVVSVIARDSRPQAERILEVYAREGLVDGFRDGLHGPEPKHTMAQLNASSTLNCLDHVLWVTGCQYISCIVPAHAQGRDNKATESGSVTVEKVN